MYGKSIDMRKTPYAMILGRRARALYDVRGINDGSFSMDVAVGGGGHLEFETLFPPQTLSERGGGSSPII